MTEVEVEVVDGGDRACGELLMVLAAHALGLVPGTRLRLIATDPAAVVDLPAWCHLTGHDYLGTGRQDDDRPHYDLRTATNSRATDPARPWQLKNSTAASGTPTREEPSR